MTKKLLKETVQTALNEKYGFSPALNQIVLLEASDDRTYIRFQIRHREYVFSSFVMSDGSVWAGGDTIEKIA